MFDKDPALFPIRRDYAYAANSAIGPMYAPAAEEARAFLDAQVREGVLMAPRYARVLDDFRTAAAAMFEVEADDIAYVSNAPHFWISDEEAVRVGEAIDRLA